jgi:hypothetical protein
MQYLFLYQHIFFFHFLYPDRRALAPGTKHADSWWSSFAGPHHTFLIQQHPSGPENLHLQVPRPQEMLCSREDTLKTTHVKGTI